MPRKRVLPSTFAATLSIWMAARPIPLVPQQYAVLSAAAMAQVWVPPTAMLVNVVPPATATGTLSSAVALSPSCPYSFAPQQYASPVVVNPHEEKNPSLTDTWAQLRTLATNVGVAVKPYVVVFPGPSWPRPSSPQQ